MIRRLAKLSLLVFAQVLLASTLLASDLCKLSFDDQAGPVQLRVNTLPQGVAATPEVIVFKGHETEAHPYLALFSAGEDAVITTQVKYLLNQPYGPRVQRVVVSPTDVISLKDQSTLFSAYETFLSKLGSAIGDDKVTSIEMSQPQIVGNEVIFYALARRSRLLLKYNYVTKDLTPLSSASASEMSEVPSLVSLHSKRFVLTAVNPTKMNPGVYEIFDLETGRKVSFRFNESHIAYVKLSESGDSFVVSWHAFDKGTEENRVYAIERSQWTEGGAPHDLSGFKLLHRFSGKILATSHSLTRFAVDESREVQSIKPVLLDFSERKRRRVALSGWSEIQKRLRKARGLGWKLAFTDTSSEMSPDGSFFSLKIRLSQGEGFKELEKDLFLLWNIQTNTPPRVVTSENLDSLLATEPNSENYSTNLTGMAWGRQTAVHLLDDGTLLIARSLVLSNRRDIAVDIVKVKESESFLPVQTGIFRDLDLDPFQLRSEWLGVTHLQISPNGTWVALDIAGVGLRVLRIN